MAAKILGSQRDFSYGEVDPALKRADEHPARKGGLRQMVNARILNSGALQDRPGRRALQFAASRVDEVTIAPGIVYRFNFVTANGGTLNIYDTSGVLAFSQGALGFTLSNIQLLTFAVLQSSVYIAGPNIQPLVTTWTAPNTWSALVGFNGLTTAGGQNRRFFYRISPKGITMFPSAGTGNITVQFSANILVAGHVNTLMRYINREILITGINSASNCNATVVEPLPPSQTVNVSGDPRTIFNLGDVIIGSVSGSQGQIVTLTATQVGVQLLSALVISGAPTSINPYFRNLSGPVPAQQAASITGFVATDILAGPGGSIAITSLSTVGGPNAMTFWDEEVMNNLQGWPASVFADQNRLGFCNFPTVPNGIGWSALGSPADHYVGANPGDAMFELVPGKVQVYHVVPGPESSEFVFCDKRIYYIPISETSPLKPGSVAFKLLSGDGSSRVQPRNAQEAILYVNAGQNSVMAVIATGAYLRPFNTKNLSDYHGHLFNNIVAIAAPSADGTFSERYAYVLNGDSSIAVGKYDSQSLSGNLPAIGWGAWSGAGTANWITSRDAVVQMVSTYPGISLLEQVDDTLYLDGAMFVNAAPAAFAPAVGLGPLWFWAGHTVSLMDQVTRSMGTYQVDANGNLVPQNNAGENLLAGSLVAGQPWTMTVEPFCPNAAPGNDVGQRMSTRRISRFAAYVTHSTGFLMARLFAGPITRTSPALGTVVNQRRVAAWNQDDDPTLPPPQRETAERWRPIGRAFDPRVAIIKDTPGPLQILELGIETSI